MAGPFSRPLGSGGRPKKTYVRHTATTYVHRRQVLDVCPWGTHFVMLDLDCYPFWPWTMPTLCRRTGQVFFGKCRKTFVRTGSQCNVPGWASKVSIPKPPHQNIADGNQSWSGSLFTTFYDVTLCKGFMFGSLMAFSKGLLKDMVYDPVIENDAKHVIFKNHGLGNKQKT